MDRLELASLELGFQSPSGVLGVCGKSDDIESDMDYEFQSPSGVLGVCRRQRRVGWDGVWGSCFSPLPGF